MGVDFATIERAIDEFTLNGYRTIMAHAERYECLENDIELVRELIDRGAYVQINCRSLMGGKNKSDFPLDNRAARCRKLTKEGCVHFLAYDAN